MTDGNPFAAAAAGVAPTPVQPAQLQPGATQFAQPPQTGFALPAQTGGFAMPPAGPPGGMPAQQSLAQLRADAIDEVDFDSNIQTGQLDRFPKLNKDQVARIAFLLFNEKGHPRFKATTYFSHGWNTPGQKGISFLAPKDPVLIKACVDKFGEPRTRFGTIVMHYDTDSYGRIVNTNFKLVAYTFGSDKWNIFKQRHGEWGLRNYDITLNCQEAGFQKMDIAISPDSTWQGFRNGQPLPTGATPATVTAEILANAAALFEGPLNKAMGYARTDAEIQYLLQHGDFPAQPGQPGGQAPMSMPQQQGVNPFQPQGFGAQPTPQQIATNAGVGPGQSANFADLVTSTTADTPPPQPDTPPVETQPAPPPAA